MSAELRKRKLDKAFTHIDVNGAGAIERDDLLGLGARLLVGFGESPTSVRGDRLVQSFDRIWTALSAQLGRDGDGAISCQEFHASMTSAFIEGDRFDPVFRPAASAVAELCDEDGDGRVGPREFRMLLSAFGTAYDDVDEAFDRLDHDRDGTLAVADLVEAAREFYTGDDPHAAGNWLFGPL
ncbi:EF-hand domain-containing protein [Nonomuraea africana]|uniref:Ca2+-binding EF-hand superfamily protein n=1 Tax=Nonomuraea africana TaxID=46171 RepID=A0ABR9KI95_9ACTN|nr:EF-hand domain-containing protein [Nonomuraea africana]MBE1561685.1 Ca2+-binding EF-hand superfamily protein [Nonomuraea africana]